MKTDFLEIGVITRPHGVRGDVKLRLHNPDSDALGAMREVVLKPADGPPERLEIESVRGAGRELIVSFRGVLGRDAAEALRARTVWVARQLLPGLEAGEYYLVDLIGASVVLAGKPIGTVVDVRPDPSVDTLILDLASPAAPGGTVRAEQPLLDVWVGPFDHASNTLELLSDDGLIL